MEPIFEPLVLSLGNLTITPFGVSLALASLVYFFLVWRYFRRDFDEEAVINFSLATWLTFLFGGRLIFGILNLQDWKADIFSWLAFWHRGGFSHLGGVFLAVLVAIFFSSRKGWRVGYFLEGMTRPGLWAGLIISLGAFFASGETIVFFYSFFFVLSLAITKLFAGYRSFPWYPSGQPGFLFLVVLILFFLFEGVLDFCFPNRLYWRGIISFLLLAVSCLSLYILAKKK